MIDALKTKALQLRKQRSSLAPTAQFHLAEIQKIGKNQSNRQTTEQEAIQYLKKAVQKLQENPSADEAEIVMLADMLPQMASDFEVRTFIQHLESTGVDISNKGVVMAAVKKRFGVLVDMKAVRAML